MCRNSLQRSRSTLSPRKWNSVAALMAVVSQSMASNRAEPIAGIITLSSSCPACVMCAMALSCPRTWKHTWFSISNITGLTLPGMMLEPGCTAGSRISPLPVRELGGGVHCVIRCGVEPGAGGAAAQADFAQGIAGFVETPRAAPQRPGIGVEFAADGGRHGVLQMGAAALHSVDFFGADASVFVGHGVHGFH